MFRLAVVKKPIELDIPLSHGINKGTQSKTKCNNYIKQIAAVYNLSLSHPLKSILSKAKHETKKMFKYNITQFTMFS